MAVNDGQHPQMSALAGKVALALSRGASTSSRPRLTYTVARLIGIVQRQAMQAEDPAFKRPTTDVDFTSKILLVVDEVGMLDTPSLHKLLSLGALTLTACKESPDLATGGASNPSYAFYAPNGRSLRC